MTTLADLLRAVLDRPADDTARLAYADRLQESGQEERAEFIRVQVGLARLAAPERVVRFTFRSDAAWWQQAIHAGPQPTQTSTHLLNACGTCQPGALCDYHRLRGRERYLWELHGVPNQSAWGFDLPGLKVVLTPIEGEDFMLGNGDIEGVFRRGFVERIECEALHWLQHAARLTAAHPVGKVVLTTVPEVVIDDTTYPHTAHFPGHQPRSLPPAPDLPEQLPGLMGYTRSVVVWLLSALWPRITFGLREFDPAAHPRDGRWVDREAIAAAAEVFRQAASAMTPAFEAATAAFRQFGRAAVAALESLPPGQQAVIRALVRERDAENAVARQLVADRDAIADELADTSPI